MLIDIRVKSELPRHRKFKKLKRLIGDGAMEHLITLWCNVAEQLPNGALNGLSNEDIADLSNWDGDADKFVNALVDSGFLDKTETGYYPHDWTEHQPWVVGAKERSAAARKAGIASAETRRLKHGTAQPIKPVSNDSRTDRSRVVPDVRPNGSRTPSPSPSPSQNKEKICRNDDFLKFWEAYPVKKSKQPSIILWNRLVRDKELPPVEVLLTAIRNQTAERARKAQGNKKQFIPEWKHPSTWLKAKAWEDGTEECSDEVKDRLTETGYDPVTKKYIGGPKVAL
jgi:hypothetical protein